MAKACPKDYTEYIARTKKLVDKWLEGIDEVDLPVAIKSLHLKLYDQNPEKAEAFRQVINQTYPDYISYNAFEEELDLSIAPVGITKTDITPFIDEITSIDSQYNSGLDQEDANNNTKDDFVKTRFAQLQVGQAGLDAFKPIFMAAVGERITNQEYAYIMDDLVPSNDTFESFLTAIDSKYEGYTGTPEQMRQLKQIYTVFQPNNRMKAEDRLTLLWTNLNPQETDIYKAVMSRVSKKFQKIREIDLKTGNKEPDRVSTNFIDVSDAKIFGKSINEITIYVPLSKMVNVYRKKAGPSLNDPGWFAVDANMEITSPTFHSWNSELSTMVRLIGGKKRSIPHVIAGINSGDPATLMITQIPDAIFKMLLPQEEVRSFVAKGKLPEKTAKYLIGKNYSLHYALRDALPELKKRGVAPKGAIKQKRTPASQFMRLRYDQLSELTTLLAAKNYVEYFKGEKKKGYIGDNELNQFIANIGNIPIRDGRPIMPMHLYLSGIIATHEWWKAVRYNTYAINDNARKTYDRARLNKVPGIVENGRGPRTHFIFDQERVDFYFNGEKVDHMVYVKGLGVINLNDGMSWVSTEDLAITSETLGRYPIYAFESKVGEVKAVDVERSEDGMDYIEKKHSSQKAIPGLEIRDKRTKETLLYTTREMGQVRIFAKDPDGAMVLIDEVSDLDVVKTAIGKWDIRKKRISSYIGELKESSRRVVILPPTVAHTTSPGPRQWMSNLYIDSIANKAVQSDLDFFRDTFEEYMLGEADKHIELLLDVFEHPSFMRKLLRKKWAQEADAHDNLRSMLVATNGSGIHHPTYMSQIRPMLNNMILNNGVLQFRTFEDKITGKRQPIVGTDGVLKSDVGRELGDNHNKFMASADLQVIRDYAEQKLKKEIGDEDWDAYLAKTESEKIGILNGALEGLVNARAMTWRTPTLNLGALGVDTLDQLKEEEGQALYFTPENIAKTKQGDTDIDHANVVFIPDELANALEAFMDTQFYKDQREVTANLDLFEEQPSSSMADYNGRISDAVTQIQGQGTQGIMANMKTVTAVLSYKFNNITLTDGTVVRAKKPTELTVMDYAPLNKNMSLEELKAEFPSFSSIIEAEDGNRYLKTTVEHEHTILANAATDHPKTGKLVNVFGFNGPDWVIPRMFKVAGNKPLTSFHIKALRKLMRTFNYSNMLRGTMYDGRPMDMQTFFYLANQLSDFLDMTPENQEATLKDTINWEVTQTIGGNKVKATVGIQAIESKGKVVSSEKLIIRPVQKMKERYGENAPKHPGFIDPREHQIIHYLAVKDLTDHIINNQVEYGINEPGVINAAEKFIGRFAAKYYDMFYLLQNKEGEYVGQSSIARAQFDEDLWSFIKQAEKELNALTQAHGDGVAVWATVLFAQGVGTVKGTKFIQRKNIRHFPPIEVMDTGTFKKFMDLWEMYRGNESVRTDFSQLEEIGRHKWNPGQMIKKRKC